jgi:outer membrane protein OmpA-like peptidoglycan-associated protein/plastocyanin
MIKNKLAALGSAVIAIPLTGCGVLASNGLNYSSYPIPRIPEATTVTTVSCQMPEAGQTVSLEGCKVGDTVVLHGVNFEFNKAVLTLNAKSLLDKVADALVARPDIKVEIDGHTDGKGTDAYNQKLSENRAASVATYLAGHGVDPGRMTSRGFGKTMPIADNATDEGREQNRRVELKVVESAAPTTTVTARSKNDAVVVLEPLAAHANEPGAGIPTSIGVVTHVPNPVEAGPTLGYKNSPPTVPDAPKAGPAWKAPAGSTSYVEPAATAPTTSSMPADMPMNMPTPASGSSTEITSTGNAVSISNYSFVPQKLIVAVGTTVTWTNKDAVTHTVKFPDKDQTIATGQSFTRTFGKPGEYTYICGIHTSMKGTIVVQ